MPKRCCVPQCVQEYSVTNGAASCFRFPTDEALRQKWITNIPRKNWVPTKYSSVCELHFLPDEVIRPNKYLQSDGTIKMVPTTSKLKANSVPSIFKNVHDYLPKKESMIRKALETRRQNQMQRRIHLEKVVNRYVSSTVVKTNATKLQICRLCLKLPKNGFIKVDKTIIQIMDALLLKLDMDITKDPIVCEDCVEVAKNCLEFKSSCINTEKIILSFPTAREKPQHNIKDILKQRKHLELIDNEDLGVCRFCMAQLEKSNFVSLNTLRNESMLKMIIISEIDLDIIENPIVCTTCKGNLEVYFKFVLNCIDTEENVNAYYKEMLIDCMGKRKWHKTQILFKNILNYLQGNPQLSPVKEESNLLENMKCADPKVYSQLIKLQEQLDIKANDINLVKNSLFSSMQEDVLQVTKSESSDVEVDKNVVGTDNTKKLLALIYRVASGIKVYKCSLCPYKGKHKSNLKKHMVKHVSKIEIYKCVICSYEFRDKDTLRAHMLGHKDASEPEIYKCTLCAFKSKYRHSIKKHMLVHTDISKLKFYKCSLCTFQTKRQHNLKKHLLIHRDVSEIEMHKCSLCTYQTKHRTNLKIHMIVHRDSSETEMYKCSLCAFETKRKSGLKSHVLVHKNVSETNCGTK